jgi:hypothetical protein
VAVNPHARANFKYGFYTNTSATQRTVIGQEPAIVDGSYINGLVLGANSPKPAKMKAYTGATAAADGQPAIAGGWDSTFVSYDKIDDARAANWKMISRPKARRGGASKRSKVVYIRIGLTDPDTGEPSGPQIKYAWNMPLELYNAITSDDRAALGIRDATADDLDLVFGARHPNPPKAIYVAAGTESITTKSTMIDPDALNNLPTGWQPAEKSLYL